MLDEDSELEPTNKLSAEKLKEVKSKQKADKIVTAVELS